MMRSTLVSAWLSIPNHSRLRQNTNIFDCVKVLKKHLFHVSKQSQQIALLWLHVNVDEIFSNRMNKYKNKTHQNKKTQSLVCSTIIKVSTCKCICSLFLGQAQHLDVIGSLEHAVGSRWIHVFEVTFRVYHFYLQNRRIKININIIGCSFY